MLCKRLDEMSLLGGKTKTQISFAVTAKLISAFVFATLIVQFLLYLNPKFQASSSFLCLYRSVCIISVRKPHRWFSHEAAQMMESQKHVHFDNNREVNSEKEKRLYCKDKIRKMNTAKW